MKQMTASVPEHTPNCRCLANAGALECPSGPLFQGLSALISRVAGKRFVSDGKLRQRFVGGAKGNPERRPRLACTLGSGFVLGGTCVLGTWSILQASNVIFRYFHRTRQDLPMHQIKPVVPAKIAKLFTLPRTSRIDFGGRR